MEDFVSPDGAVRVEYQELEARASHWIRNPRVVHVPSGDVLLDLWHPRHSELDGLARWEGGRLVLEMRRYPGAEPSFDLAIDPEARTYDVVRGRCPESVRTQLDVALRPPWLDTSEYPFASHFLDTNGVRLHYVDEGRGPPVLMVHGQPTWSFLYRHLIRGLSARYRCVAVDLPGFGLSEKPRRWPYTPERHAACLAALVLHLDLRDLTLVVHDWGGPIGLGWATTHRERVARIVALDTWMGPLAGQRAGRWLARVLGSGAGRLATRRTNLFVEVFMRRALGAAWPSVAAAYRGPLARPEDRQGSALFPRMLCDPWLDATWERREALADVPALLVWGGRDTASSAAVRERLTGVFRRCDVSVHPDVGPFVPEELGARLAPAVERFLAD